ncbi:hypothetical protein CEXT_655121 [Caerostris extrusa]|uniref:Uncharacterized protein n=1 Tax=Caerostris extrusa TaxID=172846 RepID=A0AAV4VRW4_CAEEX|nr:hypothetical protein CEXT_655121 [Caerostris extrusa]
MNPRTENLSRNTRERSAQCKTAWDLMTQTTVRPSGWRDDGLHFLMRKCCADRFDRFKNGRLFGLEPTQ